MTQVLNQNSNKITAKNNLGDFFHSEKLLKKNEVLDDLQRDGLMLIQNKDGYKFSTDSVLLSDFATIKKGGVFVDLCSGSGVVAILFNSKNNAKMGFLVEIDSNASDMSNRTLVYNNISNLKAVCGDVKDSPKLVGYEIADTVMVNPPYFNNGKVSDKNDIASARHEIDLSMDDVVISASKLLKFGGKFYMVNSAERLSDIICSLRANKLEPKKLRIVYPKASKAPNLVLVEAVKGGKSGLTIMSPLILNNEDGSETEELKKIYNRK